jgi:hypothetical protein
MMGDFLSNLSGSEIVGVVAIAGSLLVGLLIVLTAIISHNWRRMRQFDIETALKQEMVRKGMSADEIERIIRVTRPGDDQPGGRPSSPAAQPVQEMSPRQLDAQVATDLANMGMDADKIEHAVSALVAADHDTKRAVAQAVSKMIKNGSEEEQILACVLALSKSRTTAFTPL